MKKTLVLAGMLLAVSTPLLSLHADDAVQSKNVVRKGSDSARVAAANHATLHPNRETIYITNRTVTGSNIPVVVTRYQGHNIASSPFVSYDQSELNTTGALSVGGALVTVDPAISYGRGR